MNILVTGAGGFIGKHIVKTLKELRGIQVFEVFHETDEELLALYLSKCDFVYHLAGVNRSDNEKDFTEGNILFTDKILRILEQTDNRCPVLYASSIHARWGTLYGLSKKAAEELLLNHQKANKGQVYIYRLTNLFGTGARPNYNSVIATFCYNTMKGLPITVHDRNTLLTLCYIEDVVEEFLQVLHEGGHQERDGYYFVPKAYQVDLGTLSDTILSFRGRNIDKELLSDFDKRLYETYLSYTYI